MPSEAGGSAANVSNQGRARARPEARRKLLRCSETALLLILDSQLLFRVKDIALDDQAHQVAQAISLFSELYRQVIYIGIIAER